MATVKLDITKYLPKLIDKRTADKIGRQLKKDWLSAVSKGTSPVKGHGRFEGYSKNYKIGRKTPVNLKLTRKLWKKITYWPGKKNSLWFGLRNDDDPIYAKRHNEGLKKMPTRRFLPVNDETFLVTTMKNMRNIIIKRIDELTGK